MLHAPWPWIDASLAHARRQRAKPRSLRLESLEDRALMTLNGNVLFPADNPWNHNVAGAPTAGNSAAMVSHVGTSSPLHPDFGTVYQGANIGIPYNVVSGTQAVINVVIDAYASESDLVPVPIPPGAVIEGDPLSAAQNTGDRHLLVYDKDHNVVYELFNVHRPGEIDGQWHADSEAVWDLKVNSFRTPGDTSADAAGLPILPGLVRVDEVLDQQVINHALRFTVPTSTQAYVYPASHQAGSVTNVDYPRMGERFRLKQSFDISGFSAPNRVILQALKDYGMIVADNGSGWYLSGAPASRWDDDNLHALSAIVGNNFEAIDLTAVVSSLDQTSGASGGGTAVTVHGQNFTGVTGQLQVLFGTTPAAQVNVISDTLLVATSPAHAAGTVHITVKTPYGTSQARAIDQFTFGTAAATIVGRYLFYNQSAFDGSTPGVSTNDDGAIAPDKTVYIANGTAQAFSAVSSYSRGINGIMVDLAGPGSHASIGASDFVFKTGNSNTPSAWSAAPAPTTISVRTGAGVSGSDRVEIIWGANAVTNASLEVQVLATPRTGLTATDTFFWSSLIGDTGAPTPTTFSTTVAGDGGAILAALGSSVGITSLYDIDRTNSVTVAGDRGAAIANLGTIARLNISGTAPLAPTAATAAPLAASPGAGAEDNAVASALTGNATAPPRETSSPLPSAPAWLVDRVRKSDVGSDALDDFYRRLSVQHAGRGQAGLGKPDDRNEPSAGDDALFDPL